MDIALDAETENCARRLATLRGETVECSTWRQSLLDITPAG